MKYFAMFLMLLSLCVFTIGCQPAADTGGAGDATPAADAGADDGGEMVEEEVEIDEEMPAEEPAADEPADEEPAG